MDVQGVRIRNEGDSKSIELVIRFLRYNETPIKALLNTNYVYDQRLGINQFQHSVAFHIGTSYLFWRAKQMTGFYMNHNTGLKRVKLSRNQVLMAQLLTPLSSELLFARKVTPSKF